MLFVSERRTTPCLCCSSSYSRTPIKYEIYCDVRGLQRSVGQPRPSYPLRLIDTRHYIILDVEIGDQTERLFAHVQSTVHEISTWNTSGFNSAPRSTTRRWTAAPAPLAMSNSDALVVQRRCRGKLSRLYTCAQYPTACFTPVSSLLSTYTPRTWAAKSYRYVLTPDTSGPAIGCVSFDGQWRPAQRERAISRERTITGLRTTHAASGAVP